MNRHARYTMPSIAQREISSPFLNEERRKCCPRIMCWNHELGRSLARISFVKPCKCNSQFILDCTSVSKVKACAGVLIRNSDATCTSIHHGPPSLKDAEMASKKGWPACIFNGWLRLSDWQQANIYKLHFRSIIHMHSQTRRARMARSRSHIVRYWSEVSWITSASSTNHNSIHDFAESKYENDGWGDHHWFT